MSEITAYQEIINNLKIDNMYDKRRLLSVEQCKSPYWNVEKRIKK